MNKLRIGLLGYGKMGQAIDALITRESTPFVVAWRRGKSDPSETLDRDLAQADVVIEFTEPASAEANIKAAFQAGVPIVTGTTGWLEHLPAVEAACAAEGGSLFYAPNFSIGVNLFFAVNAYLAARMQGFEEYQVGLEETHHTSKLDAPSGTAIHLAQDILRTRPDMRTWTLTEQPSAPDELPIQSHRVPGVPGTHQVHYRGPEDEILIQHTAHSRDGFARGALGASRWLFGRKGIFTMADWLADHA